MFAKFATIFKIPELRKKIYLTLFLLFVYRMGFYIALPHIDQVKMAASFKQLQTPGDSLGQTLELVELFSASNFGNSTIFGLGIMPYISASIILQLLGSVYPPLEKLQKEGEAGRKKINEYTRYLTVALCFVQSYMWLLFLSRQMAGQGGILYSSYSGNYPTIVAAFTMTTGTIFLMWLGEQIDEYGIGNGISLIIMAGILSRIPKALNKLYETYLAKNVGLGGDTGVEKLLILAVLFVAVIVGVIFITQGQRRIPTQSAKHVRGRRVWGGQKQFLPLRVNQAGVMPIIFASSLLMFPTLILQQLRSTSMGQWFIIEQLDASFGGERGYVYNMCYIGLIYFFCYFWTAITFNPKDMANNLKDYGSFIPGHRPGKRTAEYLERVMVRITYVGAAFLALVAVIPTVIQGFLNIDFVIASFFGGTGLLIVVSVGLDLVQKIDSHLVMRNYGGLLES
ncbi:MAG: preprotein translocase subunit SecY [Planctomycetia bacterium]|nr:preprotein translocase subunit SecY [Planctomycetia bacterium]